MNGNAWVWKHQREWQKKCLDKQIKDHSTTTYQLLKIPKSVKQGLHLHQNKGQKTDLSH